MRNLLLLIALVATACTSGEPVPPKVGAETTPTTIAPTDEIEAQPTTSSGEDIEATPSQKPPPTLDYPPSADAVLVEVDRITDGDSFDAFVDGTFETIRLIGMNANEGDECFGPEARAAFVALAADTMVTIEVIDGRDDFGRLLAYVWADDHLVNAELVAAGFALARAISDHPLEQEFKTLEQAAIDAGLGLWASDACGATSDASIEIVDLLANAPGPDDENPNGEWIVIENTGAEAVDLTGWVIKDESTRHRFEFPAGATLDSAASAVVYSGCGSDGGGEYYWCSDGGSIWTNSGDTGFLLDPSGNIVDSWAYSG